MAMNFETAERTARRIVGKSEPFPLKLQIWTKPAPSRFAALTRQSNTFEARSYAEVEARLRRYVLPDGGADWGYFVLTPALSSLFGFGTLRGDGSRVMWEARVIA